MRFVRNPSRARALLGSCSLLGVAIMALANSGAGQTAQACQILSIGALGGPGVTMYVREPTNPQDGEIMYTRILGQNVNLGPNTARGLKISYVKAGDIGIVSDVSFIFNDGPDTIILNFSDNELGGLPPFNPVTPCGLFPPPPPNPFCIVVVFGGRGEVYASAIQLVSGGVRTKVLVKFDSNDGLVDPFGQPASDALTLRVIP